MAVRSTYTFVELEVPPAFYDLVVRKLVEAGRTDCFELGLLQRDLPKHPNVGPIDMHGLALTRGPDQPSAEWLRREAVDVAQARELGVAVAEFLADHPRKVEPAKAAAGAAATGEAVWPADTIAGAISRSGA